MSYRYEVKKCNHPAFLVERKADANYGIWDNVGKAFVTDGSGKIALRRKADADRAARSANHLPAKRS